MFAIENFIEIQVVGFLLLIALSPLLNLVSPAIRVKEGFCPIIEDISDKSAKTIFLIVLAFCVGVAGNRLIDDLIDEVKLQGDETYSKRFETWAKESPKPETPARPEVNIKTGEFTNPAEPKRPPSLKLAEYTVAKDNEYARSYFERHKSLMRVLRGAAFASLLLLLSMLVYRLAQANKKLALCNRYTTAYFIIAFALFMIFSFAYRRESTHYYRRVCELSTQIPKCGDE